MFFHMEPLIVFDSKKCIGCHSCEIACQLENDAPPGLRLRRVRAHVSGEYPAAGEHFISRACFHCNDPSCVSACPAGALHRRADGVVEHFRNKCIGCGYCIQTCPFHVPQFSRDQHVMRKCGFCIQRIDRGKIPACAAKCATGALAYFSERALAEGISGYGANERLHMIYKLESGPKDYSLPDPVPLNTTTSSQIWNWLMGLIPGGILLAWLWKTAEDQEEDNE
jgi:Fe-S-cluster-containing dehydrogenase component